MLQEEREEEAEVAGGAKGCFSAVENMGLGPQGEAGSPCRSLPAAPSSTLLQQAVSDTPPGWQQLAAVLYLALILPAVPQEESHTNTTRALEDTDACPRLRQLWGLPSLLEHLCQPGTTTASPKKMQSK